MEGVLAPFTRYQSGRFVSDHVRVRKISFNQINKKTGHRVKYLKVDADTGEEVSNDEIIKGYKVDTDTYVEMSKEELENIALESLTTCPIS